jgi:hypothetical protein
MMKLDDEIKYTHYIDKLYDEIIWWNLIDTLNDEIKKWLKPASMNLLSEE